jgi:hypothetical protein
MCGIPFIFLMFAESSVVVILHWAVHAARVADRIGRCSNFIWLLGQRSLSFRLLYSDHHNCIPGYFHVGVILFLEGVVLAYDLVWWQSFMKLMFFFFHDFFPL